MNRLIINVVKTHRARRKDNDICSNLNVLVQNNPIGDVDNTKFLGIMIDSKLNLSEHVKYISHKVSKGIVIINKTRKHMNRKGLIKLYNHIL